MDDEAPEDPSDGDRPKRVVKRLVFWLAPLYVVLLLFPIQYQETKALMVLGAFALWTAALFVWWPRRWVRLTLLGIAGTVVILVTLPGREPDREELRADYRRGLSAYGSARYMWGGETPIGIDCSGLVRQGLVLGQLFDGIRTLNGTPIRNALSLWWHDASAQALGNGYMTQSLGRYDSVNDIPEGVAAVGDLAVTTDGVHVLVYVGEQTWMEADPALGRVVSEKVPSDNAWFETPVVLTRWDALAG